MNATLTVPAFLMLLAAALATGPAGCAAPSSHPGDGTGLGSHTDPLRSLMRYEWRGNVDESGLAEPSGLVHHEQRDTLFAVGDEGDILEMERDGTTVRHRTLLEGADLEGITRDPATGLLYVAIEGEEAILEVDPDELSILRRFDLPRTFRGRTVMAAGGEGIEAITFVPNADHRLGGTFFVANQAFTLDAPEDRSALVEVELPIREAAGPDATTPRLLAYHPVDVIDLAALHYDRASGHLFVACDSPNVLLEISTEGRLRRGWALPGDEQEGLAVLEDQSVYIAQDVGGILHIRWTNRPD